MHFNQRMYLTERGCLQTCSMRAWVMCQQTRPHRCRLLSLRAHRALLDTASTQQPVLSARAPTPAHSANVLARVMSRITIPTGKPMATIRPATCTASAAVSSARQVQPLLPRSSFAVPLPERLPDYKHQGSLAALMKVLSKKLRKESASKTCQLR